MTRGTGYQLDLLDIFLVLTLLVLGSRFFIPGKLDQDANYNNEKNLLPTEPPEQEPYIDEQTEKPFLPPAVEPSGESEKETPPMDDAETTGEPQEAATEQTPDDGIVAESQLESPVAVLPAGGLAKSEPAIIFKTG